MLERDKEVMVGIAKTKMMDELKRDVKGLKSDIIRLENKLDETTKVLFDGIQQHMRIWLHPDTHSGYSRKYCSDKLEYATY